jgi:hypothetical protein
MCKACRVPCHTLTNLADLRRRLKTGREDMLFIISADHRSYYKLVQGYELTAILEM